mgnify:CR=1 FL=1
MAFNIYIDNISGEAADLRVSFPLSGVVGMLLTKAMLFHKEAAVNFEKSGYKYGLYDEALGEYLSYSRTLSSYGYSSEKEPTLVYKECTSFTTSSIDDVVSMLMVALKDDKKGRHPIHVLVSDPSIDSKLIAGLVKKKSVDIDAADNMGQTVLMYACVSHNYDVAGWVLQHTRGDINRVCKKSTSALHYLFRCKYETFVNDGVYNEKECIALLVKLLEKGACCFARDAEGNMPSHWAALGGYCSAVVYLVEEKNVQANLRNFSGETILHLAVRSNSQKMVAEALRLGAYWNIPNLSNELPAHIAASLGYQTIAHQFRQVCAFAEQ